MSNIDNEVLDFIIYLVERVKTNKRTGKIERCKLKDWDVNNSANYLLSQVIRQLKVSNENMYVSKSALIEWNKLTNNSGVEGLRKVQFRDKITTCGEGYYELFSGSKMSGELKKLNVGEKFVFNDIFHEEHIIPVSVIVDDLFQLYSDGKLTRESVEKTIKKISICIMLKTENADLNKIAKSKRPNSVEEVFEVVYKMANISDVKHLY